MQWPEEACRDAGGTEPLSDFISLPRREDGHPIIPTPRVTALIEAKEAWATELGTLDAVPRSITRGQLVKPRIAAPSQQTALCNHPSWEKDEDAKRALGPLLQVAGNRCPGVCSVGLLHACSVAAVQCRPHGHRSVLWAHNGRALRQPALFGLGGDVHLSRAAQQHAEPVRLSLLHRHFSRIPLVAVGWLRGRAAADQAADHHVPRPLAAQRGDMERRDGQRLCSVYVPRGLRQGPERHRN